MVDGDGSLILLPFTPLLSSYSPVQPEAPNSEAVGTRTFYRMITRGLLVFQRFTIPFCHSANLMGQMVFRSSFLDPRDE
jgi:hypothetical protein